MLPSAPNPPSKHHYLPEFYLRAWCGDDGKLARFKHEAGGLTARRRYPGAIGWERDLYRAPHEHLTDWQAQALETSFFSPIDNDAARCHARLLAGEIDGWPDSDRIAWVMFVRSLFHRTPQGFQRVRATARKIYRETLVKLERDYANRREPTDPETFEGFAATLHPELPERSSYELLAHVISGEKVGARILSAAWGVINLEPAGLELLLSDARPALVPLNEPFGHVAIPISPTKAFIAATDQRAVDGIMAASALAIVKKMNQLTVDNASELVVASDTRQARFIENHFRGARVDLNRP